MLHTRHGFTGVFWIFLRAAVNFLPVQWNCSSNTLPLLLTVIKDFVIVSVISFSCRHRGGEECPERARLPQTPRLLQGELWHWIPGNWLHSFLLSRHFPLIYSLLSYLPPAQEACKFQSCSLPKLTVKCLQIYIKAYTAARAMSLQADRRPAEIRLPWWRLAQI